MFRTALRNVLAHKARLLMTVLAVMLGVAFVSGTLVFTNTISDAYQKSSAKGFDQVDVAIQPESQADKGDTVGKEPKLTQPLLDKAATVPGAASAIGVVNGFTAIADKDGKLIGGGFQSQGGNYWGDKDPRYPLTSGHAPRARTRSRSTRRPRSARATRSATPYGCRSTARSSRPPSPASSPPTTATSPRAAASPSSTRRPRSSSSTRSARTTRST